MEVGHIMACIYFRVPEYAALSKPQYLAEKRRLHIELLKLQQWVMDAGKKIAVVVEGRDASGKGSTIRRLVQHLRERKTTDTRGYRVVSLGPPTADESRHWFERYERYLPQSGEIVFFDRSWYNRALIEPAMGYCNEQQYRAFIDTVNDWESGLRARGVILLKIYLSIDRLTQRRRMRRRGDSPLKNWKLSDHDLIVLGRWDVITRYETQMLAATSSRQSPWAVIDSNDRVISRLNAMRLVVNSIDYAGLTDAAGIQSTRYQEGAIANVNTVL